jgi:hypothetical protein
MFPPFSAVSALWPAAGKRAKSEGRPSRAAFAFYKTRFFVRSAYFFRRSRREASSS